MHIAITASFLVPTLVLLTLHFNQVLDHIPILILRVLPTSHRAL
jgi:hypothetical protein